MKDLAIVVQNSNKNVTVIDTINTIKMTGFENVFIQWYDNKKWKVSKEEQVKLCKKLGLNIIFLHLGYYSIDSIWQADEKGEEVLQKYIRNLDKCKIYNIPMVVMHLTNSEDKVLYNELGLSRIKRLVEYAKKLNIKIAFENTKVKGYLEYVLQNITDSNVGICFDSGHYHAHFKDEFDFELFKDRIFAVHLHDNYGIKDEHLLPFDGNIDWKYIVRKLKQANYKGPITLESCYRNDYLDMNLNEFYKKGYDIGFKLLDMFNND